jgi:hypothetical protein
MRKRENLMANYNNKTWEIRDRRTPEQKLWIAVLKAAVEDALDERELDYKGYIRPSVVRNMEKDYFLVPNRSLYAVCRHAGYEPEYVIKKMKKKLCGTTLER